RTRARDLVHRRRPGQRGRAREVRGMIDVTRIPFAGELPPAGSCVRVERPEAGLAIVVLDPPHRSLAVLDAALLRDLEAAITDLERDPSLQGIVITGRAPDQ